MYQLFISDVIKQKQIQKTQSALVLLVALPIDQQLIRAPAQSERRAHAVWNMLSARRLVNAASMPFYGSCAYHSWIYTKWLNTKLWMLELPDRMTTRIQFQLATRDNATYSCPCANGSVSKIRPTKAKLCPWALWTLKQYAKIMGYCLRIIAKGKPDASEVIWNMHNVNISMLPACGPVLIRTCRKYLPISNNSSMVPLISPRATSTLRMHIYLSHIVMMATAAHPSRVNAMSGHTITPQTYAPCPNL